MNIISLYGYLWKYCDEILFRLELTVSIGSGAVFGVLRKLSRARDNTVADTQPLLMSDEWWMNEQVEDEHNAVTVQGELFLASPWLFLAAIDTYYSTSFSFQSFSLHTSDSKLLVTGNLHVLRFEFRDPKWVFV